MPSTILYLHGFNSAPQSAKAQRVQAYFAMHHPSVRLLIPALTVSPAQVAAQLEEMVSARGAGDFHGVIGSSLGGYYALYLHARIGLPAVLINPAVRPFERLTEYLGENTNYYTGERYQVTPAHMAELRALCLPVVNDPDKLYLLTQTADETLDFHEAVQVLNGVRMWIQYGGSHAFERFDTVLCSIADFLLSPSF